MALGAFTPRGDRRGHTRREDAYCLSVYLLDHDRNGRSLRVTVASDFEDLDEQAVSREETGRGVYLTWRVVGSVRIEVAKVEGHNAVASGLFVDPAR